MHYRLLTNGFAILTITLTGCPKPSVSGLEQSAPEEVEPPITVNTNAGEPSMDPKTAPVVRKSADIETHAGETALIYGTYVEIDTRKASTPPPVYAGHAAVQLADGTQVLLGSYSQDSAIRPEKERNELRDKEVIAEGLLHSICPPSPAGASLMLPCLYPLLYVLTPEIQALLAD